MSLSIQINMQGLARLQRRLQPLSALDISPLLETLATEVESQTRRRIQEEKHAPDGSPWAELSTRYAARKVEKKGASVGLLEYGGDLRDSLVSNVSGNEAVISMGSNLIYAATHQLGDSRRNIPARPFMGISDENLGDLQGLVDDWLDQLLEN